MDFELPSKTNFTIYSKSGCPNCSKVKKLLEDEKMIFNVIDCDEYLIEEKENFLSFIKNAAEKECKIFPIIFLDGKFIGGYNETIQQIEKLKITFEENIFF